MAKPRGNKTAPVSRGLLIAFLVLTIVTAIFAGFATAFALEWGEEGAAAYDTSNASLATNCIVVIWCLIPGTIIPSLDLDHRLDHKGRLSAWLIHIVVSAFALLGSFGATLAKAIVLNRLEEKYRNYQYHFHNLSYQYNIQFPFWFVCILLQIATLTVACIYLHKFLAARKDIEPAKVDGWNELTRRGSTAKSEIDHTQA
ncbi:hypothetical protein IE81DRAFT_342419 [Ceraceosorus guamensis]|uniref:Uncharacterized protein n=1 Tax=Ceraceosorus guamensis TaxID=1522189 RepID=A0A316VZK7_9BASI|nr:hypothetical protein IE81DRAFT_342419 [Ceraceosorus guamensis]PWN40925.1 hypothetical protein IE81DRAFT_342419 [Ceraceosorus guamensis]